ncbi:MAG: type IV secretion protein IcmL [Rhodanobacter sp.]|nr:MAG: type IV secretion protein IcmL [Rhodanobacter sp.]
MSPQPTRSPANRAQTIDPKIVLDLSQQVFYKRHFGRLLTALMVLGISNVVLCAGFIWRESQHVDRQYFAVEQGTGRLIRLAPMNEPHLQGANLLTWLQTCVTQANTYDFVNYQSQFMKNKDCFTREGWQQFQAAMDRAGTLQTVRNQRLVASAVADGAPVIAQEGLLNGAYTWMIQIPVTVTYQGGEAGRGSSTQHLLVKTLVSNVPAWASKEGVGIAQYVATER